MVVGCVVGPNWYAYCGNDPVSFVDPLGLCKGSAEDGEGEVPLIVQDLLWAQKWAKVPNPVIRERLMKEAGPHPSLRARLNEPPSFRAYKGPKRWGKFGQTIDRFLSRQLAKAVGVGADSSYKTFEGMFNGTIERHAMTEFDVWPASERLRDQALQVALLAVPVAKLGAMGSGLSFYNSGTGWLKYHDKMGGHALSRHVGKTDAQLLKRLATSKVKISGASTFTNQKVAERVISHTISVNRYKVQAWLRSASAGSRLRLNYMGMNTIGRGTFRASSGVKNLTNARIILKTTGNNKYFVLTAFPQ